MKALLTFGIVAISALALSACDFTLQGATERAVATKDIAKATLDAICARPEDDVVRVDIREALQKISDVDSRMICTEGLDKYLTSVVTDRIDGTEEIVVEEVVVDEAE